MELTLLHNNSILYNRELQSEDQKAQQCFFKDGKKPGGLQAGNSCDVHLQVLTAWWAHSGQEFNVIHLWIPGLPQWTTHKNLMDEI